MKQLSARILWAIALALVLASCGQPVASPTPTPAHLDGTEWVRTSLNGSDLVEGSNITLTFAAGRAGGFAGCNGYGSEYVEEPHTAAAGVATLTIPVIEITLQLCQAPDGVMEQEAAYSEALTGATVFRMMD